MTSLDRTPQGTDVSCAWLYAWLTFFTVLATLSTVLILAFTGNDDAAVAVAAGGLAAGLIGGAVKVTIHIRR
ncbi:hypothetical protein OG416_38830 [Streptomyces longwoodensis]|uniref:hypothetical protein n=1 Tax=Streptomyces longwoodensis TaxID=68231 RepID=UPI0030E5361E|nr:hypothetical protein OG416_38830 [Streptomyces longwoodensis]